MPPAAERSGGTGNRNGRNSQPPGEAAARCLRGRVSHVRLGRMNGTKLVFILLGGALATVLIFQAINQFS